MGYSGYSRYSGYSSRKSSGGSAYDPKKSAPFGRVDYEKISNTVNLQSIIDFLMRPTYGGLAAADAALSGKQPVEVVKEFGKGITGEKKMTGTQLLDKHFNLEGMHDAQKYAMGAVVEMALDPLNYVSLGAIAKGVGKVIKQIPGIDKSIQAIKASKAYDTAMHPIKSFQKMVTWAGDVPPVLRELHDEHYYIMRGQAKSLIDRMADQYKDYYKMAPESRAFVLEAIEKIKGIGKHGEYVEVTPEAFRRGLMEAMDSFNSRGIKIAPDSKMVDIIKLAVKHRQDFLKMEAKHGITYGPIKNIGYILHSVTPEGKSALEKVHAGIRQSGFLYFNEPRHASMLHRSFMNLVLPENFYETVKQFNQDVGTKLFREMSAGGRNPFKIQMAEPRLAKFMSIIRSIPSEQRIKIKAVGGIGTMEYMTIPEINKAAREGTLEILRKSDGTYLKVKEFMSEDVPVLMATRGLRAIHAVENRKFLDDVVNQFGKPTRAPGEFLISPNLVERVYKRKVYFDPEIAESIDRMQTLFQPNPETQAFLRTFDRIQNLWKWWTTVPIPAQQARNVIGNMINMNLAGMNFKSYGTAHQIEYMTKGFVKSRSGKVYSFQQLRELAKKYGIEGRGRIGADLGLDGIHAQMNRGVMHSVMQFSENIEDFFRKALFYDGILDKGKTPLQARQTVSKYLFDYDQLTDVERRVFRRLIPFYTWSRKNIPLQISTFINKPRSLPMNIQHALRQMSDPMDYEEWMPESMKEQNPFIIHRDSEGKAWVMLMQNFVPMYDIETAIGLIPSHRTPPTLQSLITPFITKPLEVMQNMNYYLGTQIEKFPGQSVTKIGTAMPASIANLLSNIRLLSEIERLNPGEIFGTKDRPSIFGVYNSKAVDIPFILRLANFLAGARLRTIDVENLHQQYRRKYYRNLYYLERTEKWLRGQMEVENADAVRRQIERLKAKEPAKTLNLRHGVN